MSNSIIGHNIEPVVFTTEWEVEVDDDEYEDDDFFDDDFDDEN